MANPNRDTAAGAAFIDLRALSKTQGRNVAELLDLYLLEGFLGRLAASPHSPHLVLKGGALLAAYGTRRPHRDVNLLATDLHVNTDTVLALVRDIAALPRDDGLEFDPASAAAHVIRDEDEYSGVRVSMTATLGRAHLTFHVNVNVGDPVLAHPRTGHRSRTARRTRRAARLPATGGVRGEDRHRAAAPAPRTPAGGTSPTRLPPTRPAGRGTAPT